MDDILRSGIKIKRRIAVFIQMTLSISKHDIYSDAAGV